MRNSRDKKELEKNRQEKWDEYRKFVETYLVLDKDTENFIKLPKVEGEYLIDYMTINDQGSPFM